MDLDIFKVGTYQDLRFGLINYEVYRVSEDKFELNDMSGGWQQTLVSYEQLRSIVRGELELSSLDWF